MLKKKFFLVGIVLGCVLRSFSAPAPSLTISGPQKGVPDLNSGDVEYRKEFTPVVLQGMAGYAEARARFIAGLPKKSTLVVMSRLRENTDEIRLGEIKVSLIDVASSKVSGRIMNTIKQPSAYGKGEAITVPESQLVGWAIRHVDGSQEGNVFANYIKSLGDGADLSALLADQRDLDILSLEQSPRLEDTIIETLRGFFDDPLLKVEKVTHDGLLEDWPALKERYRGMKPAEIVADLQAKAESGRKVRRVIVEGVSNENDPTATLTIYIVLKHNGRIFEVRQFIHFDFERKSRLDNVGWGIRSIRIVKPKTA